jgi:hypothetical protein
VVLNPPLPSKFISLTFSTIRSTEIFNFLRSGGTGGLMLRLLFRVGFTLKIELYHVLRTLGSIS